MSEQVFVIRCPDCKANLIAADPDRAQSVALAEMVRYAILNGLLMVSVQSPVELSNCICEECEEKTARGGYCE